MAITQKAYKYPAHLRALELAVLKLYMGYYRFLIVEMPPRHGKSEYVSKYLPAWWLGQRPQDRVMLASYEATFADKWGMRTRDLTAEYGPTIFGTRLREDVSARDAWETSSGGGMVTAGVGGPMTGKGANLLIIDDPIKNAEDALSKTMRDKVWDWWRSTAYTRLEPNAKAIVVMTRWHQDDLVGRLLAHAGSGDEDAEQWERLKLPAIAGTADPIGRAPGEALWPERYPLSRLKQIRNATGGYWWSALYQQDPTPEGGTPYQRQWARQYKQTEASYILMTPLGPVIWPKQRCIVFSIMDLAVSLKERADFTVLSTWALTPHRDLILLDVDRRKLEAPDQTGMMHKARRRWQTRYIGVESTAYQLSLVQYAKREGIPVKPIKAEGDKYSRAITGGAVMESGRLYWPQWAPWLAEFEAEVYNFPTAEHDDQTDTVSYAAIVASKSAAQGTVDE